ncbi:MAG: hypothetical protein K0S65_4810 [Labilithrix sp.]|nr:hypothetical protein [Labilithrix sp.]
MNVEQVTTERALAIARTLDPTTNSWLRFGAAGPEVRLFEAEGGCVAIVGTEARLGHPLTERAAVAIARATAHIPLTQAWGATTSVRAFVEARSESGWRSVFVGAEMMRSATSQPRPIAGEMRRASELGGPALPPPFDAWMRAFVEEGFEPGMGPPPVSADQLFFWSLDGEPRAMAGALPRGGDAIRIVTVYTPPAMRGAGWAGALVHAMTARCEVPYVTLDVMDENLPARRAYERAGFRAVLATERWLRPAATSTG